VIPALQVNISAEESKSGVSVKALADLAEQIRAMPKLRLRGLMAVPARESDFAKKRIPFQKMRQQQEQLINAGMPLDVLSMGMSGDMNAAIAEGSTIVRIGTAIFGARDYSRS